MRSTRGQCGQASVELVALLPLLVVTALALWQAVVAGQAIWLAAAAARAGARAHALGADPGPAARRTLPPRLEAGLRVRAGDDGDVRVTLRIPSVLTKGAVATTTARARFVPQTS
jgi:hypothetical protein